MFVLAFAALLAAPVGQVQIIVHRLTTELTVLQYSVEKWLKTEKHADVRIMSSKADCYHIK